MIGVVEGRDRGVGGAALLVHQPKVTVGWVRGRGSLRTAATERVMAESVDGDQDEVVCCHK